MFFGQRLRDRIPADLFKTAVLVVVLLSGLGLVYKACFSNSALELDRCPTPLRSQRPGDLMTISDYSVTAFALLNGARVIAYAPQIRCLTRDNGNAAAVSLVTWTLFTLANAATVAYALLVINDHLMAGLFALNLLGCLAIVVLIGKKRLFSASSRRIAGHDPVDHGMFKRLLLAWRRSAQKRLELHLRLTLPASRLKRWQSPFSDLSAADRYRHHPYVRD